MVVDYKDTDTKPKVIKGLGSYKDEVDIFIDQVLSAVGKKWPTVSHSRKPLPKGGYVIEITGTGELAGKLHGTITKKSTGGFQIEISKK